MSIADLHALASRSVPGWIVAVVTGDDATEFGVDRPLDLWTLHLAEMQEIRAKIFPVARETIERKFSGHPVPLTLF